MRSAFFTGAAVLLVIAAAAYATPTISVGDNKIAENATGQWVSIYVTGGDQIAGFDLVAQIMPVGGDPDADFSGPAITDIDFITGAIFAASDGGSKEIGDGSAQPVQYAGGSVEMGTTVAADGLLCRIEIDTTGFFLADDPNQWELLLTNAFDDSGSRFRVPGGAILTSSVTNGTITLPEPATMVLLAMGGLALLRRRRTA